MNHLTVVYRSHLTCCAQLGGIVTPNDGHCHLDSHGMYTESLNQVSLHLSFDILILNRPVVDTLL